MKTGMPGHYDRIPGLKRIVRIKSYLSSTSNWLLGHSEIFLCSVFHRCKLHRPTRTPMPQKIQKASKVLRLHLCLLCLSLASILAAGQNPQRNASKLTIALKITNGALDIDRAQSKFVASDEFRRRLSIPPAEAEQIVFDNLAELLKKIPKPYRFALSDADKALDDKGQLNDTKTNAIRTANSNWSDYLQQYDAWTSSTNRTSMPEVFSSFESDALGPLVTAADATALLVWDDGSFDAEQGTF